MARLSTGEKNIIAQNLLRHTGEDGRPEHGKLQEMAVLYGVSRKTVSTLWIAAKKQMEDNGAIRFICPRMGLQYKKHVVVDHAKIKSIPFQDRTTIRKLARKLDVSKSQVGRWVKTKEIKSHTNAIKPLLTQLNMLLRFKFCLSWLQVDRLLNKVRFGSMHNVVHMDEKWFYITRTTEKYYISTEEEQEQMPHRTCQSKRFITKVMFECAVSRPMYASDGTCIWDGKIGMFPFTTMVPAKRSSKSREKGTLELKPIDAITQPVYKHMMINWVVPAIKAKWPPFASKSIIIQQDNAKPHIDDNDVDFRAVANADGWDIHLLNQPANSPDLNINDLGWFRAIQSLQCDHTAYNVQDLCKNVSLAFEELTDTTLNKVFLTLQSCMVEILRKAGNNNYILPHMGKDSLIRANTLPEYVEVDEVFVRECIDYFNQSFLDTGDAYNLGTLMSDLGY